VKQEDFLDKVVDRLVKDTKLFSGKSTRDTYGQIMMTYPWSPNLYGELGIYDPSNFFYRELCSHSKEIYSLSEDECKYVFKEYIFRMKLKVRIAKRKNLSESKEDKQKKLYDFIMDDLISNTKVYMNMLDLEVDNRDISPHKYTPFGVYDVQSWQRSLGKFYEDRSLGGYLKDVYGLTRSEMVGIVNDYIQYVNNELKNSDVFGVMNESENKRIKFYNWIADDIINNFVLPPGHGYFTVVAASYYIKDLSWTMPFNWLEETDFDETKLEIKYKGNFERFFSLYGIKIDEIDDVLMVFLKKLQRKHLSEIES
jgi:hypothetical protein